MCLQEIKDEIIDAGKESVDIVNIGLHFFLKDVRPMLPPVMNRSIVGDRFKFCVNVKN